MSDVGVDVERVLREPASGRTAPCRVVAAGSDQGVTLRVLSTATDVEVDVTVDGDDGEEALLRLRDPLEGRGWMLLCNRYRRDAFVTSLARQMSGGWSCYLVEPATELDPEQVVASLDPAPAADVVRSAEADAFIARWQAWFGQPAPIRWWTTRFGRSRGSHRSR